MFAQCRPFSGMMTKLNNHVGSNCCQICVLMTLVASFIRLNAVALFYMLVIAIMISLPAARLARIWPYLMGLYVLLVVCECGSALGLPPGL
jgi:hypothetical protein